MEMGPELSTGHACFYKLAALPSTWARRIFTSDVGLSRSSVWMDARRLTLVIPLLLASSKRQG